MIDNSRYTEALLRRSLQTQQEQAHQIALLRRENSGLQVAAISTKLKEIIDEILNRASNHFLDERLLDPESFRPKIRTCHPDRATGALIKADVTDPTVLACTQYAANHQTSRLIEAYTLSKTTPTQEPENYSPVQETTLTNLLLETTPVAVENQLERSKTYFAIKDRILTERFKKQKIGALNLGLTRNLISHELNLTFDFKKTKAKIQAKKEDILIEESTRLYQPVPQLLARFDTIFGANQEEMLQKIKELSNVKTMDQFEQFLGVEHHPILASRLKQLMMRRLCKTDAQIRLCTNNDNAFKRYFQKTGYLGIIEVVAEALQKDIIL